MSLDYQIHFLGQKHVEEVATHRTGGVAGTYAVFVSRDYGPLYPKTSRIVYCCRNPVVVDICFGIRPATVLVCARQVFRLRATTRPVWVQCLGANPSNVIDLRRCEYETCQRIGCWIVEVVLLTIAGTRHRTTCNRYAEGQRTVADVPFIAVSLSKGC